MAWNGTRRLSVSLHEPLVDYMLSAGTPVLVAAGKMVRNKPKMEYQMPDQSVSADVQARQLSFAAQLRVWRKGIRWLVQHWKTNPLGHPISPCVSLHQHGYVYDMVGLTGTPKFAAGPQVQRRLWQYFHSGGKAQHTLKRRWG